ncbi:MAG: nitrate- and nitrite sensing domain-containing protein, partial [Pseudonocardia sp.]|nr:nitrate- and nitrite sensing domain-containing protein [Pseudonocardia sp.]
MTTTELRPSWSERLNPRNWTLAWKLVAIGLVPALLALGLGVLRIADQAESAAALGSSNRLLEIRGQVAAAADALRQERDEAALYVATGRTGDRGVLDVSIGQTDDAAQSALAALRASTELDDTTSAAVAQAEQALSELAPLRADVSTGGTNADAVVERYTETISRVDGLDRALLRQLRTPDVAGLADALTAATSAREQLAIQHTVLGVAIRAGQLQPDDVAASVAADNRLASEITNYEIALTPEQLTRFGTFGGSGAIGELTRVKNQILATPTDRPVVVDPAEWDAAYSAALTAVQDVGGLIRDEVAALSAAAEETASNLAGINSVILMLGLLIGITIAVLVARALIRSLRVLRTSALDVAERRLPQAVESMRAGESPDITVDPVPLDSRDEVGQVARAFDAVHGQAIRLAADQAALQTNVSSMFVNLSRRSQALVERQLQLIEQLESNEQDPDQLSNLFQLDHLATRMRRNSENLLVLAGTDLAKRNIAPVPMVDVLRAAVSEIEQYQRIVVQSPPTTTIVGRAASDLVHLLAELLDNATNFSPPDSQVVMSTARTAEGAILVEIADRGVGMIDYELADANRRLGGPSAVDVSASRRMGLFVVGRLGTRHGIGVQLDTSSADGPGSGLTASVTVPAHLVPTVEGERPGPARVDAAPSPSAFDVPPPRAAVNGSGRPGSLSDLVAGTDGPMSPPSAFDPGPRPRRNRRTPVPSTNRSGPPPLPPP